MPSHSESYHLASARKHLEKAETYLQEARRLNEKLANYYKNKHEVDWFSPKSWEFSV
jgi:hypothetical protein